MYAVVAAGFAHRGTSRIYFTVHEVKSLVNLNIRNSLSLFASIPRGIRNDSPVRSASMLAIPSVSELHAGGLSSGASRSFRL
jgi:hypothetical protein